MSNAARVRSWLSVAKHDTRNALAPASRNRFRMGSTVVGNGRPVNNLLRTLSHISSVERLAVQRSGRRQADAAILRLCLCGDQIRFNGLFASSMDSGPAALSLQHPPAFRTLDDQEGFASTAVARPPDQGDDFQRTGRGT